LRLSLLFWEAAEGGIGVWERLVAEPREFHRVARRVARLSFRGPGPSHAPVHCEEVERAPTGWRRACPGH
jgi:hypothetical protein